MRRKVAKSQSRKVTKSMSVSKFKVLSSKFLVLLFLLMINIAAWSQSAEALEKKINSIQKDIKLAEKLLKETSKNKETTINQVSLLQTQIKQRESLIRTYQNQVNALNRDIQKNKNEIAALKLIIDSLS